MKRIQVQFNHIQYYLLQRGIIIIVMKKHCFIVLEIFVFYSLLHILVALNVAPTWISNSYMQAKTLLLYDGNSCNCAAQSNTSPSPKATTTFSPAFTQAPNLAYGIMSYQGYQHLVQQSVQLTRANLTSTSVEIDLKIVGITKIFYFEVRYIAISKLFPHHVNCFDNVPVNYNFGSLTNISSNTGSSIAVYTNTINYTLQALSVGSSYINFTTPITNSKIVLFLNSFQIVGQSQNSGNFHPLNLTIEAYPVSTTQYTIIAHFGTTCLTRILHFSMIIYDQYSVRITGQYIIVNDRVSLNTSGGHYEFPLPIQSNFMVGFLQFYSDRTQKAFNFMNDFGYASSKYGMILNPAGTINSNTPVSSGIFNVFYLKSWTCPSGQYLDHSITMCTDCLMAYCTKCLNSTYCLQCDQANKYFVDPSTHQCFLCTIPGCTYCTSPTTCSNCSLTLNYVLQNNTCVLCNTSGNYFANITSQVCQLCSIPFCITCSSLYTCSHCDNQNFYGLTTTQLCSYCDYGQNNLINTTTQYCQACSLNNCLNCSTLTTCQYCNQTNGYFINSTDKLCYPCALPHCVICSNLTFCSLCNIFQTYVLNTTTGLCELCPTNLFPNLTTLSCEPCSLDNCLNCTTLTICNSCNISNLFYLQNQICSYCDPLQNQFINLTNIYCEKCVPTNCIKCSNLTACDICDSSINYVLDLSLLCIPCQIPNCINCSSITTCSICNQTANYYLNFSSLLCEVCNLTGCLLCQTLYTCDICDLNNSYGHDYTSLNYSLCGQCNVSCVCDGYTTPWIQSEQRCTAFCGDGLIRLDQQCDDNNSISGDGCSSFCRVQPYFVCDKGQPTICNQSLYFQAQLLGIEKAGCNSFKMQLSYTSYLPFSLVKDAVTILNQGIEVIAISETQKGVQLVGEYKKNIIRQNIQIKFTPGSLINITYQNSVPALFYSKEQCHTKQNIETLLKVVQITSYVVLIFSILSCKIIGLELFGVLQLSYFSLSMQDFFVLYLEPLSQFRTFNGLNLQMTKQSSGTPINLSQLKISKNFLNNCNVMIIILFAELFIGFALYLVGKKLVKEKIKNFSVRMMKQGFVTLVLFNIFNISYSAGIHWKHASSADQGYLGGSFLLYITLIGVIVATFLMQVLKEQGYGQFKQKFKKVWICKFYIPLTIIYRGVLGIYAATQFDYDEGTLIIISFTIPFLLYFIVNLPFSCVVQNYRAAFIHITMFYILLTTNYYTGMKMNTPLQVKGKLFTAGMIQIVLIALSLIFSFLSLAYEISKDIKSYLKNRRQIQEDKQIIRQNNKTEQSFQNI